MGEGRVQEPSRGEQQTETPLPQRMNTKKKSKHDPNHPEPSISTRQEVPGKDQVVELVPERAPKSQPVTEENEFLLEQQESYLRLPIPQENTTVRKCWRCGEEGHSKKGCNRQVSCTFCQVYSHATRACKKYASFVQNSQGTSSKRTTPIQTGIRMQGPRYMTNHYLRFQPPVVPPILRLPVITQTVQAPPYLRQPLRQVSNTSPQDVRNDPNYVNQGTQESRTTSQLQGPPQEEGLYVKYPIPIGNEAIPATHSSVQPQPRGGDEHSSPSPEVQQVQPHEQQQVPQREGPQMSSKQQRQLYAKIKQQQQQIKLMQQQNQQLQQQQWQHQIAELQKSGAPKQEQPAPPTLPE